MPEKQAETPEQNSADPSFSRALHVTFDEHFQMGVKIENLSPIHLLAVGEWIRWHALSLLDQQALAAMSRQIEVARGMPRQ